MTEIRDRRHSSWFWMDKTILDEYGPTIGAYGIAVYAFLARYADNKGQAFPSLVTMARAVGLSKQSVIRTIDLLCKSHLIEKSLRTSEHGDATSNVYTLLQIGGSSPQEPPSHSQEPPSPPERPPRTPQEPPSHSQELGVVPVGNYGSTCEVLPITFLTRLTEQDLTEQEKKDPPSPPTGGSRATSPPKYGTAFEHFWQVYPCKVKKAAAAALWHRHHLTPFVDTIVTDIHARLASYPPWQEGYINHPTTYLRGRMWEDEWRTVPQRRGGSVAPILTPDAKVRRKAQRNIESARQLGEPIQPEWEEALR